MVILRPGLPSQMIEVHDPVRLLIIIEHLPETVLNTIQRDAQTYEWFKNDWVNLVVVNPETNQQFSSRMETSQNTSRSIKLREFLTPIT